MSAGVGGGGLLTAAGSSGVAHKSRAVRAERPNQSAQVLLQPTPAADTHAEKVRRFRRSAHLQTGFQLICFFLRSSDAQVRRDSLRVAHLLRGAVGEHRAGYRGKERTRHSRVTVRNQQVLGMINKSSKTEKNNRKKMRKHVNVVLL